MPNAIAYPTSFIISYQDEVAVRGKKRLDFEVAPPPDLAWEIDITSRTHPSIYQALNIPELWRFERSKLQINLLRERSYVESKHSPNFPGMPLFEVIPQYLEPSKTAGKNAALKAFRQ